jgi:hypothetical protein
VQVLKVLKMLKAKREVVWRYGDWRCEAAAEEFAFAGPRGAMLRCFKILSPPSWMPCL